MGAIDGTAQMRERSRVRSFGLMLCTAFGCYGACACSPEEPAQASAGGVTQPETTEQKSGRHDSILFDTRAEPSGANCPSGGTAILRGSDRNRDNRLDAGEVTSTQYVCNGTNGSAGTNGKNSLIATRPEPISTACPTGGTAISVGLDQNENGLLDAGEVQQTSYVCNGLNGTDGRNGTDGKNGLVALIPQEPGDRCATGGVGVYSGLDLDGDGLLQSTEVRATVFVCNGANGAGGVNGASAAVRQTAEGAGANCAHGGTRIETGLDDDRDGSLDDAEVNHTSFVCDGAPGRAGQPGQPGLNALVSAVAEAPGANCAEGGVRIDLGTDDDRDGVLDASEVDATQYACDGAGGGSADGVAVRHTVDEVSETELPLLGGQRHDFWVDTSGDGQKQEAEVIAQLTIARLSRPIGGSAGCSAGQVRVEVGLDLDLDRSLNDAEVLEVRCINAALSGLSAGGFHDCVTLTDGSARCWGNNSAGQLGDGATTNPSPPVAVSLAGIASISAGGSHTCATLRDGSARCWGENIHGQLGDGTTTRSSLPVPVSGLTGVASISAGVRQTCAILTDSSVRCWGYNGNGALGNGTQVSSTIPVQVSGLAGVAGITIGDLHACARLIDGSARCWGAAWDGQLGNGVPEGIAPHPVGVSGLTGVVSLSAGSFHTCATVTDGSAHCWGRNSRQQLGRGSAEDTTARPAPVTGLTGAASIAAGDLHTCAMLTNGTVRCWGANSSSGRLGNGNFLDQPRPVEVWQLTRAVSISAGKDHTCAMLIDSVLCWGSTLQVLVPVPVPLAL
jgi:hypothetical protein